MTDDRDLRVRFERLRSEDSALAEPAARVLARIHRGARSSERPRQWSPGIWVPALVVVMLGVLIGWLIPVGLSEPVPVADEFRLAGIELEALGSLRTPTDALLEMGELDLTRDRSPEIVPLPKFPDVPARRESSLGYRSVS